MSEGGEDRLRLGIDGEEFRFSGRDQLRDLSLSLCQQSGREILILSQALEPYSYNTQAMYDALKQLALSSPKAEVRILLQDNQEFRRGGHRLLELLQRLSSRILLHRPSMQEHREQAENFLLVDETGYLRQPLYSRPEGVVCFAGPAEARRLRRQFEQIWQQSAEDSLVRRLSI